MNSESYKEKLEHEIIKWNRLREKHAVSLNNNLNLNNFKS